ncbi:hypothetical protein K2173_013485 [Erythroxylum novogranatense]|uniref:Kinesin motor domain-containing protein n=1 Tax=Erythroxylum novogranatense TaxID=1862640 RepID=A0AAV8SAI9_9ROSI|nr:hypothetical protein K2173_013485 [Erythroxylum novogranatense]
MIQGTEEELGIAVLAMVEVLSVAEEKGKLVSMSFYEIVQERVYDMLDQKRQEVSILEAHGKIQHKGLSQARVASMAEFQKLYCGDRGGMRKLDQKIAAEHPSRSHKGLIIYVSSCCENGDDVVVGKMNFVDLAGYEDARRKSRDGQTCVENIKMINKSIYALQNVVYSLKANEVHVPYQQSKLTRLLQGSLGGTNRILLVSCLNPSICQDSLYMLSLASRCGQGTSRAISDSTKKISRSDKNLARASHRSQLHESSSNISKKQVVCNMPFPEKKAATNGLALKTRKLFDKTSQLKSEKMSSLDNDLATEHSTHEEEGSSPLVL